MTPEKEAYTQGHYDGWFRLTTTDQRYNIGPLAAEYAKGYKDGRSEEYSSRVTAFN